MSALVKLWNLVKVGVVNSVAMLLVFNLFINFVFGFHRNQKTNCLASIVLIGPLQLAGLYLIIRII